MGVQNIKRVVVLMLENRSFDHMLGDLQGVDGASPGNANVDSSGKLYAQTKRNNLVLPLNLDPKHEFTNVQTQLGPIGAMGASRSMSGFVVDAQDTATKTSGYSDATPDVRQAAVQSVMDYFADGALPALHKLANQFAVCDRWFASVPGPTWPNRFFAMMGSCHGQLQMPTGPLDAIVTVRSIAAQLGKDSIFSVLTGVAHQIYSDYLVPLSIFLKGSGDRASLDQFERDVDSGNLPQFSWIEPDYSSNLAHANSQHPPENVLRGDNLIARIYNKLSTSKLWDETLLVILHDEHGGFYDHVPPAPTQSADDSPSHPAFDYSYTGVRVPCVLVSPWIQRGVLSDVYDHTSLLAFICDQFQLPQQRALLGRRTAAAGHFGTSLMWSDEKRTDVPAPLAISPIDQQLGEEASADLDEMLPKLLSGLSAHAQASAKVNVLPTKSLTMHVTAAANDIKIAQAWEQGGKLNEDDIKRMVAQVKQTFTH
jgi:phospholipase C